ncbi:hypothetical protein B0H14DRAFT_3434406 [Mycena olivaceomarginata]|nr:hypothetical protein B0H14DRAFT_3434406 [Mycena olivaceomarginata]
MLPRPEAPCAASVSERQCGAEGSESTVSAMSEWGRRGPNPPASDTAPRHRPFPRPPTSKTDALTLFRCRPTPHINAEVSRTRPSSRQRHRSVAPSLSTCVSGLHTPAACPRLLRTLLLPLRAPHITAASRGSVPSAYRDTASSLALTRDRVVTDVPVTAPRPHSHLGPRKPLPPVQPHPHCFCVATPHPIPHPRHICAARHASAAAVALPTATLRPRPFTAPISSLPAFASLLRPLHAPVSVSACPSRPRTPPHPSALPHCHACPVPPPPHRRAVSAHPHRLRATYVIPATAIDADTPTSHFNPLV